MDRAPSAAGRKATRRRLWTHKGGNIAVITALTMIPLTFALGMAFDFTLAQSRKDQIDGMADVAALGSVTPSMMTGSAANSKTQATSLFNGQISTVSGVVYNNTNLTVTSNDTASGTQITRTTAVTYSAASQNVFASLLGMSTFPISGTATATSSVSPNIDFYLLLDTSPSMEIAATSAGIAQLEGLTTAQQGSAGWSPASTPSGCAFGCHESNPTAGDVAGNPGGEDNYTLAHNNNISLRIDLVKTATQNLMSTAQTTAADNGAKYRAAIYTFDVNVNSLQSLTSSLSSAQTAAGNIAPLEVYSNNYLTSSNNNQDEDTYADSALTSINTTLPKPGNGTNNTGDTPQEVLFIVTDGLNDESVSGSRVYPAIDATAALCTAIKKRGIRIAVLYTVYFPLDSDPVGGLTWYDEYVDPMASAGVPKASAPLPQISPDAQACASQGLFYAVSTDGDISAALTALFQKAVATARLTQ